MGREAVSRVGERHVERPNSFIFTLYGDMVHRRSGEGSLWVGSLIKIMASFGVSAAAVPKPFRGCPVRGG